MHKAIMPSYARRGLVDPPPAAAVLRDRVRGVGGQPDPWRRVRALDDVEVIEVVLVGQAPFQPLQIAGRLDDGARALRRRLRERSGP